MKIEIKNICCIGAGYVGGPTMAVIADRCHDIQINVVDVNENRIQAWNSENLSHLPIYEPNLDQVIKRRRGRNLHFSTEIKYHISNADMIFISVNTPTKTKGIGAGKASDLKWVEASARQVSKYAKGETIVVEKSTLPVKTALMIRQILETSLEKTNDSQTDNKQFYVLSNPEFLSEGTAIQDLECPDRVLIGGENQEAIKALVNIYLNWVDKEKILTTDLWSSELSKLIANAFLAQRISSINSISALCEATGADVKEVSTAIGADKRIGNYFLNASPGFGGSCFKKDILNLVYICNYYGLHEVSEYWQKIIDINNWQKQRILRVIVEKLFGSVSGKKLAILGFAFKANTNDTRESAAIHICNELIIEGGNLYIYDPRVTRKQIEEDLEISENEYSYGGEGSWTFADSILDASRGADAVIVLTEWDEFKNIEWSEISTVMRSPSWLFDTRSITDQSEAKRCGMKLWSLGCGSKLQSINLMPS